jgi:hypothetical protein
MRMDWIAANCRDQEGFQVCRKCGGNLEIVGAHMSLHDPRFADACVGSGKVVRLAIPFCPRCEAQPAEQGCIHEPAGAHLLGKSDLDNYRDLFGPSFFTKGA